MGEMAEYYMDHAEMDFPYPKARRSPQLNFDEWRGDFVGMWRKGDKALMLISEMTSEHISHALRLMERRDPQANTRRVYQELLRAQPSAKQEPKSK